MSVSARQILEALKTAPEGLTSAEVSEKLGAANYDPRGRLSKLAAYGEVEKMKGTSPSGKTKWRLVGRVEVKPFIKREEGCD